MTVTQNLSPGIAVLGVAVGAGWAAQTSPVAAMFIALFGSIAALAVAEEA